MCAEADLTNAYLSPKRHSLLCVSQEGKQKPANTMLNNFNKGRSTKLRKSGYVTVDSSTGEVSADCPYISELQRPFTAVICHNLSNREVCISPRGIYSMQDIFLL